MPSGSLLVDAMPNTTILNLPTELLDRVFSFLDWDCSNSLKPDRPDILNLSLTCRLLRTTTLPLVFGNVTLKLRWMEGALVEPALFRIRRDHPHLANYVRSVYIETQFGQLRRTYWNLKEFDVPDKLSTWLDHKGDLEGHERAVEASHQQRLQLLANTFFEEYRYPELSENCPSQLIDDLTFAWAMQKQLVGESSRTPEGSLRISSNPDSDTGPEAAQFSGSQAATKTQREAHRTARMELDALLVVVLCLPACMNALAIDTIHHHRTDILQNNFALNVAAMALGIFGDRLKRLTMITSPERMPRGARSHPLEMELQGENSIITERVLSRVTHVKSLVLSDDDGHGNPGYREISSEWQIRWHVLANTVTRLELWNIHCDDSSELAQLIAGFTSLQSLALKNIVLRTTTPVPPPPPQQLRTAQLLWLTFLIDLRRQMPDLDLGLDRLKSWSDRLQLVTIPKAGLNWLQKEAIPPGCVIGFDRETRLSEDFESFLPLWYGEDSERGQQAMEERKNGKLVDEAMASRWRTFKIRD